MKKLTASTLSVSVALCLILPPHPLANPDTTKKVSKTNYEKINLSVLTPADIAKMLEWVPDPVRHCGGYYLDPLLMEKAPLATLESPLTLSSEGEAELSQQSTVILRGNVVVTQPQQELKSDIIYLYRDPETGEPIVVDLFGNVQYREPGKLITSDKASINLTNKSGSLEHAVYRFTSFNLLETDGMASGRNSTLPNLQELTGWGTAEEINRDVNGILDVDSGTYTTCPPQQKVWKVKADKMQLNQTSGRGTAQGATLWVKDMPIFYSPYFNFPLDDRRQTGFLFPNYSTSTDSGVSLAFPFYWNIAPNYDATITPNYMSKRGLQMNAEFRYLTESSLGTIYGNILPQDRAFEDFKKDLLDYLSLNYPGRSDLEDTGDNRSFISFENATRFNQNWSTYIFLNHVSDDYYFEDFDNEQAQITDNQIQNIVNLNYNSQNWDFTGRIEAYQTLHPINQAFVANQYQKLPELILNGHYSNVFDYFDVQLNNSAAYFNKEKNPGQKLDPVIGSRVNVNPGISLPMYWMSGFINPKIQLAATEYDLQNQVLNFDKTEREAHITRTLPISSVSGGLFFDRDTTWFGKDYQQTLEPQVFYLYVPYRNQDDIPLFDTDTPPFTFDQLFRTNRFDGIDRIGDANQISFALTTRFLEEKSGVEKLRASIGQIIYFEDRQVNIDNPFTTDLVTRDNAVPPDTPTSPIVGQLMYQIDRNWRLISNAAWDPNVDTTNNGNLIFQYRPDEKHIVNFAYNYLRGGDHFAFTPETSAKNDLNQTDISTFWPITENLSGVARWNYNISHRFTQNTFAGLQYDSCCWAVRLVAGRIFKYQEENLDIRSSKPVMDTQFYLEFVLKGLGNISSSSASSLLTEGIMGFNDKFGMP